MGHPLEHKFQSALFAFRIHVRSTLYSDVCDHNLFVGIFLLDSGQKATMGFHETNCNSNGG